MDLYIGNKNYSSWSLRGWLMLKAFDVPFQEHQLALFSEDFYATLKAFNCADKVPLLKDGDVIVWESLAICEYINERYLEGAGWPSDVAARAHARAIANEMHAGFNALRNEMPMNCRALRKIEASEQAQNDIRRIESLWASLRSQYASQGDYLFGTFSIVDAMFAPVVLRFRTYGVSLSPVAQGYADAMIAHPAMQAWLDAALQETDIVPEDEAGEPV